MFSQKDPGRGDWGPWVWSRVMPEEKGAGAALWPGKEEVPHLGKGCLPDTHTPVHPGPWELTHCGWGQCGPSQTPSTASPLENPALQPAGTQRPRCLWRGSGPGSHSGSASLPASLGRTRAGVSSTPPSQTVLAPASRTAVRVRYCPHWEPPFTQRTVWKLQCAWCPRPGGIHTVHPHLGLRGDGNSFWVFVPNFS